MIWHREDANGDEDFLDAGDERWWHLTDTQFSTVAILDDGANLQERVKYDAYGKALHHRWRDVDGDRDYDSADRTIITNIAFGPTNQIGQASYRAEADLDRDGDVDTADLAIANTSYESSLAPGVLSDSTVKNTIGWDGYVFNPETTQNGGGLYTVRFRTYSTELGRWLERDPAEYIDSFNLSEYSVGAPLLFSDPTGLMKDCPSCSMTTDKLMDILTKLDVHFNAYAGYASLMDKDNLLWRIYYGLEFAECLIDCLEDDPQKLAGALAAAGWDLCKDTVVDLMALPQLLLYVSVGEDGLLEIDWGEVSTKLLEEIEEFDKDYTCKQLDRLKGADEALRNLLKDFTEEQLGKETVEKLTDKVCEIDSRARVAAKKRLIRQGINSGTRSTIKATGVGTVVLTTAELFTKTVNEIADRCKDRCKFKGDGCDLCRGE